MIKLHYFPSTASMAPHIVLEELGCPFELLKIDREGGELSSTAYRRLNPNGLIPVLEDGGIVLYETAAICLHLADTHPESGLFPPVRTAERAHGYKWLSWLSTTLQQTLVVYFYPERWADQADAVLQVQLHAARKVRLLLAQIDAQDYQLGAQAAVAQVAAAQTQRDLARKPGTFPASMPGCKGFSIARQ